MSIFALRSAMGKSEGIVYVHEHSRKIALTMAPHSTRSFLFNIICIVFIFGRAALLLIQYDLALLEVGSSLDTNFFKLTGVQPQ